MNCPWCGKEMEPGWAYSRSVLMWSAEQGKMPLIARPGDVSLKGKTPGGFSPDHPAAQICKDCRKVIIEY